MRSRLQHPGFNSTPGLRLVRLPAWQKMAGKTLRCSFPRFFVERPAFGSSTSRKCRGLTCIRGTVLAFAKPGRLGRGGEKREPQAQAPEMEGYDDDDMLDNFRSGGSGMGLKRFEGEATPVGPPPCFGVPGLPHARRSSLVGGAAPDLCSRDARGRMCECALAARLATSSARKEGTPQTHTPLPRHLVGACLCRRMPA